MALFRGVFVVAAKRTPFGTFGGKLRNTGATQLAIAAAKSAILTGNVPPVHIDSVVLGNVIQSSSDGLYAARHVGLHAGAPISSIALSVNRLCGSGFQSIVTAAEAITLGNSQLVLTGGTENMSMAPLASYNARWGTKLGIDLTFEDTLWAGLSDSYCNLPMAITAENLAEKYSISREDCDLYALQSQNRWDEANTAGKFDDELCTIQVKGRKGMEEFTTDEHPKKTSLDQLSKLQPVFKKNGVVTAGNASGICDGAGAVILASEEAVIKHGLKPLARVVCAYTAGVEPSIMGIGPAPAIRGVLKKSGYRLEDIDIIEVNEAFAAQYLAVARELNLPNDKTNMCGGAIALGHPLAASGSRITTHLIYQLIRENKKLAIGSACIGGGQGIAVLIENVNV